MMLSYARDYRGKKLEYEFKNDRAMLLALYMLFFVGAIALISVAIYCYDETKKLLERGVNTKAIVSSIITVEDSDGKSYKPVFTFLDADGHSVSFENPVSSNPIVWKRGEEVSVIYDPALPIQCKSSFLLGAISRLYYLYDDCSTLFSRKSWLLQFSFLDRSAIIY